MDTDQKRHLIELLTSPDPDAFMQGVELAQTLLSGPEWRGLVARTGDARLAAISAESISMVSKDVQAGKPVLAALLSAGARSVVARQTHSAILGTPPPFSVTLTCTGG